MHSPLLEFASACVCMALLGCDAPSDATRVVVPRIASSEPLSVGPAARPTAPLSGSLLRSGHVMFKWHPEVVGRVELRRSREAARADRVLSGTGSTIAKDLEAGRWFWRVVVNDVESASWSLRVAPRSEPLVRQGTVLGADVNGDGLADVVFAQAVAYGHAPPTAGVVLLEPPPQVACTPRGNGSFAQRCSNLRPASSVGDVDGDGRAELAIHDPVAGRWIFFRGKTAPSARDGVWRGESPIELDAAGDAAHAVGDVNGDGFADVVVGDGLFLGGTRGLATERATTLHPGQEVGAGDIDGDGLFDVVIRDRDDVHIFAGRSDGALVIVRSLKLAPAANRDGDRIRLGDLDGDGRADLVVAGIADGGGLSLHIARGGPFDTLELAPAGRFADVVGGAARWDIDPFVSGDAPRILATDRDAYHQEILTLDFHDAEFHLVPIVRVHESLNVSRNLALAGDVDGDGLDDVSVTSHADIDGTDVCSLYLGRSAPVDVLAKGNSYRWRHSEIQGARPELEVITAAQRRDDDRAARKLMLDSYGEVEP